MTSGLTILTFLPVELGLMGQVSTFLPPYKIHISFLKKKIIYLSSIYLQKFPYNVGASTGQIKLRPSQNSKI